MCRATRKVLSPQPKASSEVLNIIRLYKETAVPGAEGLTKADFRNLFFKRDPGDRRRRDKRFEEELCGDMFRLLDKDRDGYVTLQDLLEQFVPKQQVSMHFGKNVSIARHERDCVPCQGDSAREVHRDPRITWLYDCLIVCCS